MMDFSFSYLFCGHHFPSSIYKFINPPLTACFSSHYRRPSGCNMWMLLIAVANNHIYMYDSLSVRSTQSFDFHGSHFPHLREILCAIISKQRDVLVSANVEPISWILDFRLGLSSCTQMGFLLPLKSAGHLNSSIHKITGEPRQILTTIHKRDKTVLITKNSSWGTASLSDRSWTWLVQRRVSVGFAPGSSEKCPPLADLPYNGKKKACLSSAPRLACEIQTTEKRPVLLSSRIRVDAFPKITDG